MRTFATLVLVTFGLLASVPSSADDELWPSYPCFAGTLDAANATVEPRSESLIYVGVPGTLSCDVPEPGPKFAVATFGAGMGTVGDRSIRDYRTPVGPTTFTFEKHIAVGTGLCLMQNERTKLSCVRIVSTGETLTVTQVSPKDPFFDRPVILDELDPPDPNCPSCW